MGLAHPNGADQEEVLMQQITHAMGNRWGVATMDDGIIATARTRREAVIVSGMATRYKRRDIGGGVWEYNTVEGTTRIIGRVAALRKLGFDF